MRQSFIVSLLCSMSMLCSCDNAASLSTERRETVIVGSRVFRIPDIVLNYEGQSYTMAHMPGSWYGEVHVDGDHVTLDLRMEVQADRQAPVPAPSSLYIRCKGLVADGMWYPVVGAPSDMGAETASQMGFSMQGSGTIFRIPAVNGGGDSLFVRAESNNAGRECKVSIRYQPNDLAPLAATASEVTSVFLLQY